MSSTGWGCDAEGHVCDAEGRVYVTTWAPGWGDGETFIKIGMSKDPYARIAALRSQYLGWRLSDKWVSPPHVDYRANERRLLSFAARYRTPDMNGWAETYVGVPAADVIAHALAELPMLSHPDYLSTRGVVRRGTTAHCGCVVTTVRELRERAKAAAQPA